VKLAISAAGPNLSSPVDLRFGRARYLVIVDTDDRAVLPIDNQAGMNAAQGAGIQAAQIVMYLASGGTVAEAVDRFDAGDLGLAPAADVDGHR